LPPHPRRQTLDPYNREEGENDRGGCSARKGRTVEELGLDEEGLGGGRGGERREGEEQRAGGGEEERRGDEERREQDRGQQRRRPPPVSVDVCRRLGRAGGARRRRLRL
jgi:hypothetical protein